MWELNPWFNLKRGKLIVLLSLTVFIFISFSRNVTAEQTVDNNSYQQLKLASWKFEATVPKTKYIEEKWQYGKWVQTYSTTTAWLTIRWDKGYDSYKNNYNEKIWYNDNGTYNKRSYYSAYTYTTW